MKLFKHIIVLLALLGCGLQSALAVFERTDEKAHYGIFLEINHEIALAKQAVTYEVTWENQAYHYDNALDVYTYVTQNPWTKFDPFGLYESEYDFYADNGALDFGATFMSFFFGGRANREDPNVYDPPKEGVGGVSGGIIRAATLRTVPIEKNPTEASLKGIDIGASQVPVLNSTSKVITGKSAAGFEASRLEATIELGLELAVATAGLSQTSRQVSLNTQKNTRVGRWMSSEELKKMKQTKQVQEGGGGLTFSSTEGAESFKYQAKSGSVYVEYDVPSNSLLKGGKDGWVKNIGPNAPNSQQQMLKKQGGEQLPEVENLTEPLYTK